MVIWSFEGSDRLSARARKALSNPRQLLVVSIVSVWEIILKSQAGKLTLQFALRTAVEEILSEPSWSILPLRADVLDALIDLPQLHRDPFDRMLIAQARREGLTIITPDSHIRAYDIPTLW